MTAKKPADAPKGTGYTERFKLVDFSHLSEGGSILIRNPKLLPPEKIEAVVAASESTDRAVQRAAMNEVLADIIVAWRNIYPATEDLDDVDLDDGSDLEALMARLESREQVPLGKPSLETVAQLPLGITNRLAEEFKAAGANPK
jgi:hypothetical protein